MKALKTVELTGFELYNLKTDIGEQHDARKVQPQIFRRLRKQMEQIYHEVRQEGPVWPAWKFARYEAERIQWPAYWRERNSTKK